MAPKRIASDQINGGAPDRRADFLTACAPSRRPPRRPFGPPGQVAGSAVRARGLSCPESRRARQGPELARQKRNAAMFPGIVGGIVGMIVGFSDMVSPPWAGCSRYSVMRRAKSGKRVRRRSDDGEDREARRAESDHCRRRAIAERPRDRTHPAGAVRRRHVSRLRFQGLHDVPARHERLCQRTGRDWRPAAAGPGASMTAWGALSIGTPLR